MRCVLYAEMLGEGICYTSVGSLLTLAHECMSRNWQWIPLLHQIEGMSLSLPAAVEKQPGVRARVSLHAQLTSLNSRGLKAKSALKTCAGLDLLHCVLPVSPADVTASALSVTKGRRI